MRLVYHHVTDPRRMGASPWHAPRPGGHIAVIEIPPPPSWPRLDGVPERGGHGIEARDLVDEMISAGFEVDSRKVDGFGEDPCSVRFRSRPLESPPAFSYPPSPEKEIAMVPADARRPTSNVVTASLTIVVLAAWAIGCGPGERTDTTSAGREQPPAAPPAAAPAVMDMRLVGTEWQLESLGAVGEEKPILSGTRITLRFNGDGTLDGFAGCNTYRTTYRPGSAGELAVRALIRSNRECAAGVNRQETTYLDVLHRVESYEVYEDQLLLFYEGGSRDLVFRGTAPLDRDESEPTSSGPDAEGT